MNLVWTNYLNVKYRAGDIGEQLYIRERDKLFIVY